MGFQSSMGHVLGVSGRSGVGKTTLIEAMLPTFRYAGLLVNVVKHSHHDVVLEPPQKDSARFRQAGAQEVLLSSPYRYSMSAELHGADEPALDTLLARMKPADLTLVEGYHHKDMPRVVLTRGEAGLPREDVDWSSVIAIVTDESHMPGHFSVPVWPLNDPEQVAQNIRQWFARQPTVG